MPTRSIQELAVNKRKREQCKVIHNSLKRFVEIVQTGSTVVEEYANGVSSK